MNLCAKTPRPLEIPKLYKQSKMNHYTTILLSLLIFCSCKNSESKKIVSVISNEIFLKEVNDSTKTTRQILEKFSESILSFAKTDTSSFYYGNTIVEEDTIWRQIVVGKFVDRKAIIATEVNIKDTLINFYRLDSGKWKQIGSEKMHIPIFRIDFEDLDSDNRNEIVTATNFNMNGNSWKEVYRYSTATNTIQYAGSFSTDYVVKKDKKQIEETYEGSWYMDTSKTLFEWRKEKLVPIKQIILAHNKPVTDNSKLTFEYYENLTNDIDGLKLKFKEDYNDDNEKQQQLWDNFFSRD